MDTRQRSAPRAVFLIGPTAVGKTRLAVKLAKRLNLEVVSCDSMQLYKGMSVLSQAPSMDILKQVKHHLVGFADPGRDFSAARFRDEAVKKIRDILRRGKTPLVVGGSGLYVKALVDGLFPSPKGNPRFRAKMARYALQYGSAMLHKRLADIDPETASRIHPNDSRRMIRALEVYDSTKKTMSELKGMTRGLKDEFEIMIFGLTLPREELYERINSRVEDMAKSGLTGEVRTLMKARLSRTARAVLGFKEISGYLKGECGLEEAIERLKKLTRNFAKRQIAWFKADKRIVWFDLSRMSEKEIAEKIWKKLS